MSEHESSRESLPPPAASPPAMDAILIMSHAAVTVDEAVALLQHEEVALKRVISRYIRDPAGVDDVYQEVSIKILRRIDTVREPAALRGWLFQTARNASLDHLRRMQRRPDQSAGEMTGDWAAHGDLGRSPSEAFLSSERVAAVRKALSELPPGQREVIRLRIEDGLDHEGIAAKLGISRQAVEVRLCRGRAALKERLDEIIGGEL